MTLLSYRPLMTMACAVLLCSNLSAYSSDEALPFPEVNRVETNDNEAEANILLLEQNYGYNSDDPYLYRIQSGAYYHVFGSSDNGDVVQLHDASKWSVHPSQYYVVHYWGQSDDIFIKPRSSCFSSYQYVLYNRRTQEAVEVNLISPPIPAGAYTFRIVNIDPYYRLVYLSDNTIWQISSSDSNFPYWQIGQSVLIGVNNHWRTSPLPHILINVDMYQEPYSEANFYGNY